MPEGSSCISTGVGRIGDVIDAHDRARSAPTKIIGVPPKVAVTLSGSTPLASDRRSG
jgi:hypothetical protein